MESLVFYGKGMLYHIFQVIGDILLNSTLLYDYRDISRDFRMMMSEYVADINR